MSANRRPLLAVSAVLALGTVVWLRRQRDRAAAIEEASYASALAKLGAPPGGSQVGHQVHDMRRAWFVAWHRNLFGNGKGSTCKIIHVAGTNGKGTTCNALRNGLVSLGFCVGLFTSPHVHSPCERIQVGTEPVPWKALAELTHKHAPDMQPWMVPFDRYLLVALAYFAAAGCEYVILETGIGGLLDSTNYVERPVACVITSISLDHCDLLGSTIDEVAQQKAGIIKPTCKVVVTASRQHSVALRVLEKAATAAGASLVQAEPSSDHRFAYSSVASENVGMVEATLNALELDTAGLDLSGPCRWPGRFEEIHASKGKVLVILDGAHNGDAVEKLLSQVQRRHPGRRVAILFGANTDKDLATMVHPVVATSDRVVFVTSSHPLAATTANLKALALSENSTAAVSIAESVQEGLDRLLEETPPILLVCGSFYVVAAARAQLAKQYPEAFPSNDVVFKAFELGFM